MVSRVVLLLAAAAAAFLPLSAEACSMRGVYRGSLEMAMKQIERTPPAQALSARDRLLMELSGNPDLKRIALATRVAEALTEAGEEAAVASEEPVSPPRADAERAAEPASEPQS